MDGNIESIECNFCRLFHRYSVVLGPEVAVQLVLLPLDAQVEGVHGLGHLLVGILEHLDQFPRPELVAQLEEGVSCSMPACSARPPNPEKGYLIQWP